MSMSKRPRGAHVSSLEKKQRVIETVEVSSDEEEAGGPASGPELGLDAFLSEVGPTRAPTTNGAAARRPPGGSPAAAAAPASGAKQRARVREGTQSRLAALTADKEQIARLTHWAGLMRSDAAVVVDEVMLALRHAAASNKLPFWYALDSVCNALADPYAALVAPWLAELVEQAMPPGPGDVERGYLRLLHTWLEKARVGALWPAGWWQRAAPVVVARQLQAELRLLSPDSPRLRDEIAGGCARLALRNVQHAGRLVQLVVTETRRLEGRQTFVMWALIDQLARSHDTAVYRELFAPHLPALLKSHAPGPNSRTFARVLRHWMQRNIFPAAAQPIKAYLAACAPPETEGRARVVDVDGSESDDPDLPLRRSLRSPSSPGTPPPPDDVDAAPTPPSPAPASKPPPGPAGLGPMQERHLRIDEDARVFLTTPGIPHLQTLQEETGTIAEVTADGRLVLRGSGDGLQKAYDRLQSILVDEVPAVQVVPVDGQVADQDVRAIAADTHTRLSCRPGSVSIVGRACDVRQAVQRVKEALAPSAKHRLLLSPTDHEALKGRLAEVARATRTTVSSDREGDAVVLAVMGKWPCVQAAVQAIMTLVLEANPTAGAGAGAAAPPAFTLLLRGLPVTALEAEVREVLGRTYAVPVQDVRFLPLPPTDTTRTAVVGLGTPELVNRLLTGPPFQFGDRTVELAPHCAEETPPLPPPPVPLGATVLLLGEGNLTFAATLARLRRTGLGLWASTLETQEEAFGLYGEAARRAVLECQLLGVTLLFNFDVHREDPRVQGKAFEDVVANFPQPTSGLDVAQDGPGHGALLRAVLRRAAAVLKPPQGRLHLALEDHAAYRKLALLDMAQDAGLALLDIVPFLPGDWPGYQYCDPSSPVPRPPRRPYLFTFGLAAAAAASPAAPLAQLYPLLLGKGWSVEAVLAAGVLDLLPPLTEPLLQALEDHLQRSPAQLPGCPVEATIEAVVADFVASAAPALPVPIHPFLAHQPLAPPTPSPVPPTATPPPPYRPSPASHVPDAPPVGRPPVVPLPPPVECPFPLRRGEPPAYEPPEPPPPYAEATTLP